MHKCSLRGLLSSHFAIDLKWSRFSFTLFAAIVCLFWAFKQWHSSFVFLLTLAQPLDDHFNKFCTFFLIFHHFLFISIDHRTINFFTFLFHSFFSANFFISNLICTFDAIREREKKSRKMNVKCTQQCFHRNVFVSLLDFRQNSIWNVIVSISFYLILSNNA